MVTISEDAAIQVRASPSRPRLKKNRRTAASRTMPRATGATVTSAGAGCGGPAQTLVCTQIGCEMASIRPSTPPHPSAPPSHSGGPPWRVECGVDWDCDRTLWFPGFTPEFVTVRVVNPTHEVTEAFDPMYEDVKPNGGDCPPTCRIATITMTVSG